MRDRLGLLLAVAIACSEPLSAQASGATAKSAESQYRQLSLADVAGLSEISSAKTSPDGRYVAFLKLSPDIVSDSYNASIIVTAATEHTRPRLVASYRVEQAEAFELVGGHERATVGEFEWSADGGRLLYTRHFQGKMRLELWELARGRSRVIGEPHNEIQFVRDQLFQPVAIKYLDWEPQPKSAGLVDRAVIIDDDRDFWAFRRNPTDGLRRKELFSTVNWSLPNPVSGYTSSPVGSSPRPAPEQMRRGQESITLYPAATDRTGEFIAQIEWGTRDINSPVLGEAFQRLEIVSMMSAKVVAKLETGGDIHLILGIGWSKIRDEFYALERGRWTSKIIAITTSGVIRTVFEEESDLEEASQEFDLKGVGNANRSEGYSTRTNSILMVRSKDRGPAELVSINLDTGLLQSLYVANPGIGTGLRQPPVRVEFSDKRFYGRLYLPTAAGKRLVPLVVTTYRSSKGFPRSTTDEVPISALVQDGIAVLSFDADNSIVFSPNGDFRWELNHLALPLKAIEEEVDRLTQSGIIDPNRVAFSGGSYGQELAMFAYFKSDKFRTISAMGGGWSPTTDLLAGRKFGRWMRSRGYLGVDVSDPAIAKQWSEVSAAFNARPDRPPVLWQSGDAERYGSIETWYRLKEAGAQIEWLEYPDEGHSKTGPANKWWVYSRNLDWFRFWLQDYEDPDSSKMEQYQRWRAMRNAWQQAVARAGPSN